MMETSASRPHDPSEPVLAAVLAEFDEPDALLAAAAAVRNAGYTRWDAHTPYPLHGIERALGIRPTILPWIVLSAGIVGAVVAMALQWWTNAVDYPLIVSGKPWFSLPANIPIAFELIVLFSALAAFLGAILLNRLPQFSHPVFTSPRFRRATTDKFFISIEARDPVFDALRTQELLAAHGAVAVELCYQPAAAPPLPRVFISAGILAAVLALLPPLLIAKVREEPHYSPRIHLIQDMDFQPRYQAQAPSMLFADGRAMRPNVSGTIAQGQLAEDSHLIRGKNLSQNYHGSPVRAEKRGTAQGSGIGSKINDNWAATFPMPVTQAMIERGRERFQIYCATCHGLAGEGDGMTAHRAAQRQEAGTPGYTTWAVPRSLHAPSIVAQPVGQLFNTVTHGVAAPNAPNTMPGYAAQIPVDDRWAIVLYVRALQRSQNASLDDVPPEVRAQLK